MIILIPKSWDVLQTLSAESQLHGNELLDGYGLSFPLMLAIIIVVPLKLTD